MSVNYVLTAGTSTLSNIEAGHGVDNWQAGDQRGVRLNAAIEAMLEDPSDGIATQVLRRHLERVELMAEFRSEITGLASDRDPIGRFRDLPHSLVEHVGLDRADRETVSAEAGAIAADARQRRATGSGLDDHLGPHSGIRLLATDTDEGAAAAILVGWLLAQEVTALRGTERGSGSTLRGIGPAAQAEITIVPSLVVDDLGSFEESMVPLGRAVASSVVEGQDNRVLLSGGFKAVVPQVVACCEYIGERRPVTVGMHFEHSNELLTLPLRGAAPGWQEAVRDPLGHRSHPLGGWAFLDGELTSFGEVLLGLLDGLESHA